MILNKTFCLWTNKLKRTLGDDKLPQIILSDDLPEHIDDNVIYLTGTNKSWFCCTLKCPCGCGDYIELNMNSASRPRWKVKWHVNGSISLFPSINRSIGCKSHFYYKKGNIQWCDMNSTHYTY